jgi:hypothetical protein
MGLYTKYRSFSAAGPIPPKSVVKYTAARGQVAVSTSPTDPIAGVCDLGAVNAGDEVDVALAGFQEVTAAAAAAINPGDLLTTDANGLAITAVKVTGSLVRCFGVAQVPAAPGDIFLAQMAPSSIQG